MSEPLYRALMVDVRDSVWHSIDRSVSGSVSGVGYTTVFENLDIAVRSLVNWPAHLTLRNEVLR